MTKWQKWLAEKKKTSKMEVTLVPLSETRGWQVTNEAVQRPDGAFFKLIGVNIAPTAQRGVVSWDQPMLQETGEGAIVLVCCKGHFLLQTKAEPGNEAEGCVLLAPTLQASKSNLDVAHGGKKPPRAELVTENLKWYTLPQDGGRYYHKKNHYAIIKVDEMFEASANERWFKCTELESAILSGCANEHLVQAYTVWKITA